MTKLTTEITIEELQYRINAHENDLTQMWTADYLLNVQKELLALKQAAKNPIGSFHISGGQVEATTDYCRDGEWPVQDGEVLVYAAPVLPKQPELVVLTDEQIDAVLDSKANMAYIISDKRERLRMFAREIIRTAMISTAPAQPVIPEQAKREQVRREHAEWSDATFGNVGPVGPLKHLSKEALEAAAAPDDLLEWADMQFLLWDAQRRAGIPDDFITVAMIEKLEINKKRQWPEPKDGEPRLHINTQSAQHVIPEEKSAIHGTKDPEDIAFNNGFVAGWNCCRSEIISLNETTAQPVSEQPVSKPYKLEIDMDDANHFSIAHLHEIIYGKELIWPEAKLLARFMLDVKQRVSPAPAQESE